MMPWMQLFATVLVLGTLTLALLWRRVMKLHAELARLRAEREQLQTDLRDAGKASSRQSETLVERQEEIQSLKRELGAQRKKAHATSEELRDLRDEMRERAREDETKRRSRPAFEPAANPEPVNKAVATPPAEKPAPQPMVTPPAPVVDESASLRARLTDREHEIKRLTQAVAIADEEVRAARRELRRATEHSEKLRRIDVISKNRIELLEDKLKMLGRNHYEAVSELAALRGDVQPPRNERPGAPSFNIGHSDPVDATAAE